MDEQTATVETCLLGGMWVPKSLVDLIEKWAERTRENGADVFRSILNLGLAHYVEMYPHSAPQMAKAMGDLEAMAPQAAKRYRLDAVVRADGRLTLRQAHEGELDAVIFEVAVQPKLAAQLEAHAARGDSSVGDMLLSLWCIETLEEYCKRGDSGMATRILNAWQEHGLPQWVQETMQKSGESRGKESDLSLE